MTTNKGEQISFIDIFKSKDYSVEIPIIQRDYAQGRNSTKKIRDNFLDVLCDHLINENSLNLDFVYGQISNGQPNGKYKFVPLDGQQRLTTLFLIHWYVAQQSNQFRVFQEIFLADYKSKFSYETRVSSSEFCNALTKVKPDFLDPLNGDDSKTVSDLIRDTSWFFLSWKHDPTISGMLTMLDAIHDRLQDKSISYSNFLDKDLFTFNFLNLKDFKLTDDLYIKMNARGKSLTSFENYKAKVQQYLEEYHPKLEKEFTSKVDGVWTDLFWEFSHKPGEEYVTVDERMLNFFEYMTQMIYYKNNEDLVYHDIVELIPLIFSDEKNVKFLFYSLNLFVNDEYEDFSGVIKNYFESIFSEIYEAGKVCYFDENFNLFYNSLNKSNFDHKEKLLFFALLNYHFEKNAQSLIKDDQNLLDYLRISRNFILRINQKAKYQFQPEIRESDYYNILGNIEKIFDSNNCYGELRNKKFTYRRSNIDFEKEKAEIILRSDNKTIELIHKLEDHPYLRGAIHNFIKLFENEEDLESRINLVFSLWPSMPDSLLTRSLLTIGDYSTWVGSSYHYGNLYFFGKGKDWYRVLTERYEKEVDEEKALKRKQLFQHFIEKVYESDDGKPLENVLEEIVQNKLSEYNNRKWKYYFLKYPSITSNSYNIYAFEDSENGKRLEYVNGATLRCMHTGALITAVLESSGLRKEKADTSEVWQANYPQSKIKAKNGIGIIQDFDKWLLEVPKNLNVRGLSRKFSLQKGYFYDHDPRKKMPIYCYFLPAMKDKDLVETAVEFLNAT